MKRFIGTGWVRRLFGSKSLKKTQKGHVRKLTVEELEVRLAPATRIWDGGGTNDLWSNAANWVQNIAPRAGDDLIFAGDTGRDQFAVNDFPVNTRFNSITFDGDHFRLTGSPIILGSPTPNTGFLASNVGAVDNFVNFNIILGGGDSNRQFFSVGAGGANLTVNGRIFSTNQVQLTKDGPGELVLANDNSGFTGIITIVEGGLRITHRNALGTTSQPTIVLDTFPNRGQLLIDNVAGVISEPIRLNGPGPVNDGALLNVRGDNVLNGTITLGSDVTIGANADSLTLNGVISDTGLGHDLTKEGIATVVLDPLFTPNGNVYRGETFVNNGILQIRHSKALGNSTNPVQGLNGTVVGSFANRSGTLQLNYVPDNRRNDPFVVRDAKNKVIGFRVPLEALTLNGQGFEGVHVRPKDPGANGRTVFGALHNLRGDNQWNRDISLWSSDNAASNFDPLIWGQPLTVAPITGFVLSPQIDWSTVAFGAEADSSLSIYGQINDNNLAASLANPNLTQTQYSLIKTRPGRVVFVTPNTYRGRTEVLDGYLNIRDSQALGTTGFEQNGTYVFSGASLELEADLRNDSRPVVFSPDGRRHLPTDIVIGDENLLIMGDGEGGNGALRNIRGVNEISGSISLLTRIDRGNLVGSAFNPPTGVTFTDIGASIGVQPDVAPFNNPFNLSQLTVSGVIRDGTYRKTIGVFDNRTFVAGTAESADLIKVGLGELVLSPDAIDDNGVQATANTYTGITRILEGWVTVRANKALGGDQILTLIPPLGVGVDSFAQDIPYVGNTRLPYTQVAPGAALVLKRKRDTGESIDLQENLLLTGNGISHRFAELNRHGALINLSGDNIVSGNILLQSRDGLDNVGIGVELDSYESSSATVSELTLTGKLTQTIAAVPITRDAAGTGPDEDRLRVNVGAIQGSITVTYDFFNVPDQLDIDYDGRTIFTTGQVSTPTGPVTTTVQFGPGINTFLDIIVNRGSTGIPGTAWEYSAIVTPTSRPAGIEKYGHHRLILQGPGDYSGVFNILEGTVRVQNDSGLGIGYTLEPTRTTDIRPNTTTVVNGTALELADKNPALNGGVGGGIQVRDQLVLTGPGLAETQRIRVQSLVARGATFRLTYGNYTTAVLNFGATAGQVQAALNALPNIGAGGVSATSVLDATNGTYIYTITFQGKLVGANRPQITGAGGNVFITFGTTVTGGTASLTNLRGDNQALGTVRFATNVIIDTRHDNPTNTDSRLSLMGDIGGVGGLTKAGSGKLVLAGNNTYGGTTYINSGIVSAQSSTAFGLPSPNASIGGTVVANDAQLEVLNNNNIGNEALIILGNGPNTSPNIQTSWIQQGLGANIGGQTNGNENVTGRVTSVVTDPTDANVIYLTAASGGAWKSIDGGQSWLPLIDHVSDPNYPDETQTLFASCIAISPTDPRVLYIGLGCPLGSVESYYGRGILKSTDGGLTWVKMRPPGISLDRQVISKIVVDPTNADVFYFTVQSEGVNGLDISTTPLAQLAFGIWRYNPALPASLFRNAVPERWTNLNVQGTGPSFSALNRFTDLTVIDVNPHLSSPNYPLTSGNYPIRPEYRLVTFAVGDPTGHDVLVQVGDLNETNAGFVGFFTDFSDVIPGTPGQPFTAADTAGWQLAGFGNGNDTVANPLITPRNGMIKLTGTRPFTGNRAGQLAEVITQYASVAFAVNSSREFLGANEGNFRELLRYQATYNPAPNVREWNLGSWGQYNPTTTTQLGAYQGGTPTPTSLPFDNVNTNLTGAGWYANTLAVSPTNPNVLFLGGVGQPFTTGPFIYNTTATATTPVGWVDIGLLNPAPHVNYHSATFDAFGRIIVATDGGVWRFSSATPNGVWENLNGSGLSIGEIVGLDVDPFNPNRIITGSISNGIAEYGIGTYSRSLNDGHGSGVRMVTNNPDVAFYMQNNQLIRSVRNANGSFTNTVVHTVNQSPVFIGPPRYSQAFGSLTPTPNPTIVGFNITVNTTGVPLSYYPGSALPYQMSEPTAYPYLLPQYDEFKANNRDGLPESVNYGSYTNSGGYIFVLDPYNPKRLIVVQRSPLATDNDINFLMETTDGDRTPTANNPYSFKTIGTPVKWFGPVASQPNSVRIQSIGISALQGPDLDDPAFPERQRKASDEYDPGTIYVVTNHGLFVTMDGGTSWARRDTGLPTSARQTFFGGVVPPLEEYGEIFVDPRNRNVAYITRHTFRGAAGGGQIYRTADAGRTWVNISAGGDLPDLPVWKLTMNSRNGDIYIGNDNGVYRLTEKALNDGLTNNLQSFAWERYGEGLPNVQVKQIVFNPVTNTLTAGTFGRGVFTMQLDDNADEFANGQGNRGALRAITGTTDWIGTVKLTNNTDLRAERGATINFLGSLNDSVAGGNRTVNKTGGGRVILSAANNLGGLVEVKEGVLRISNPLALGAATLGGRTIVRAGAALELETNLSRERVEVSGQAVSNEVQAVTVASAVGSTFTLTYTGADATGTVVSLTTTDITIDADSATTAENIRAALQSLANIGGVLGIVTVVFDGQTGQFLISFGGTLKGIDVQQLVAAPAVNTVTTLVNGQRAPLGPTTHDVNSGAIRNVAGNNTFTGQLVLVRTQPLIDPLTGLPIEEEVVIGVEDGHSLTIGTRPGVAGVGFISDANGPLGIRKTLTGTLVLTTANTFRGNTTIDAGTVIITNPNSLGGPNSGEVTVKPGATLKIQAPQLPAPDDGGIIVKGGGSLTAPTPGAAATAAVTIIGKHLYLSGTGNTNAGALCISGQVVWQGPITLVATPDNPQASINLQTATSSFLHRGVLDGNGGLIKAGSARVTLLGNNTYDGVTTVAGGSLRIQTPDGLGSTLGGTVVNTGGQLELVGGANGLAVLGESLRLAGTGYAPNFAGALVNVVGNNTWTGSVILTDDAAIGVNPNTRLTIDGAISDTMVANLIKKGAGQLVLTASNVYRGVTSVRLGDLQVTGEIGDVSLDGGTLSGTGFVGRITTNGVNPLISIGDLTSQTGILNSEGGVWRPELRFFVNLNGTTPGGGPNGHDQLIVSGTLNLNGAQLQGTTSRQFAINESFVIIDVTGAGTITGTFAGVPNNGFVTIGTQRFRVQYTGTQVILTRRDN